MNEVPTYWDLTKKTGYLHIQSQWGAIFSGTAANVLLQDSPSGDFDTQTHLIFTPTEMMQEAGILIYQTRTDFLYLMRAYCDMPTCVGNGVYFHFMENGGYLGGENPAIVINPSEVYLRLTRRGKTYTGYFSENGMDWNIVGIHNEGIKFSPIKIGLAVADSGFFATEIPAYFDYFYVNYSVPYDNTVQLFIPLVHR
jgi:beta-xylosidase